MMDNLIDKLFPLRKLPRIVGNRIRQNPRFQKIVTPLGKSLEPERWIFVIGCYNSGTTLLKEVLSSHPDIGGLSLEGVSLTDALPRPEEFGWTRLWYRCLDEVRLEPGPGMSELADRAKRQWSLWFPGDTPNLVEKSVANTARAPFLQEYFQPAYFIYVVRDGYAASGGIRKKADPGRWNNPEYDDEYPIEFCAKQWSVSDEIVQKDKEKLDRFLQIYYEDLTETPEEVLAKITDFLGISEFPEEKIKGKWDIHEKQAEIKNMNDRSFRRLTSEDVEKIKKVAGERLEKHGYSPPPEAKLKKVS